MKTGLLIILFLFTQLVVSAQNTDAVTAYFRLIDSLQTGKRLDDSAWNQFLQVKANALYIEENGVDSQYLATLRKTLEIVYLPQNDSLLRALLGKDNMINGHYPFKEKQKEMKAYLSWLQTHDVFNTIYQAAIPHLPKRMHRFTKKPLLFYETIELGGNATNEAIYASFLLRIWVIK